MLSLNSDARFPSLENQYTGYDLSKTQIRVFLAGADLSSSMKKHVIMRQMMRQTKLYVCLQGYSALTLYEASALPEDPVGRKFAAHSVTAGPGVKVVQAPAAQ